MELPIIGPMKLFAPLLLAAAAVLAPAAHAAGYPSKPIRLVVPFPAGGSTDYAGRLAADILSKQLGGNFIVQNKPGATGSIGAAEVKRAAPDGYTLLVSSPAVFSINQYLFKSLQYDPVKDFDPITILVRAPNVLVHTLEKNNLIKPGMAVVDFAAGTGALTEAFRAGKAGASLHITAADLSPAMLEKCAAKNIADALIRQDITKQWAVPENSKDIVAATGVGEYLTDPELAGVIAQAARVLKKGGSLAFTFLPAAEGASQQHVQQEHTVSFVREQCRAHGIDLQSAGPFDAYRASDGSTVRHIAAIGVKL